MQVIIFGTGAVYKRNKDRFKHMQIVALADNDIKKQGTYIDDTIVTAPSKIADLVYDYIIIASIHHTDIRSQLISLGICADKIIDKEHLGIFANVRYLKKYGKLSSISSAKRILLVSHDMALTGAPIVLFNMAKVLKKYGYYVEAYAPCDGELKYRFLEERIPLTVFRDFNFDDDEIRSYFLSYDVIVVNTVTLYGLVHKLDTLLANVVWWLHEETYFYIKSGISKSSLMVGENVHIYGVGSRALQTFSEYCETERIQNLLYGIEDIGQKEYISHTKDKMIFAVIGTVDERKAQDVFAAAIKKNWDKWRSVAEFWVIGAIDEKSREEYGKAGTMKIWGNISHDHLMELYDEIDVVVCPSRNDPMPVVLAEAMMNKKACIASDMTGTADYMEPYKNGLICRAGDIDSLAGCIDWAIRHREECAKMGENGYKVYEQYFSMEQFERSILKIMEETLGEDK